MAFAFDEPVALSNMDVSSVDVINDSEIVNPTRASGSSWYFDMTKVCLSTLTKIH